MSEFKPFVRMSPIFLVLVSAIVIGGCGFGVSDDDKLVRATEAFETGEFRTAIIDTKSILQNAPNNAEARLLLGRASIATGAPISAEVELRRAVELGVPRARILVDLGRALLQQEKFRAVIDEVDEEEVSESEDAVVLRLITGDAWLGLGQAAEARDRYASVLAGSPGRREALLGVVLTYIVEGNLLQARQSLDHVVETNPDFARAWVTSGQISAASGDFERAIRDYGTAAELAAGPQSKETRVHALFGIADAELMAGRPAAAGDALELLRAIAQEDIRSLITAARIAAAEQDWADVQRHTQEILRQYPDHRPAQILLGRSHKERGQLEQAEMYLSAAVAADPDNRTARLLLADTRIGLRKTDEARQAIGPLLGTASDARSLSMDATISLQAGDIDAATEMLVRAVRENPSEPGLKLQLAYTLLQGGKSDAALDVLQTTEELDESAEGQSARETLLVLSLVASGDLQSALDAATSAVARRDEAPDAYMLLGVVQATIEDFASARISFMTASDLSPKAPGPHWFLGQLAEQTGNPVAAEQHYKDMLDIQPDSVRAMMSLAGLAVRSGAADDAIRWLERVRELDPRAAGPRNSLAAILLSRGDISMAQQIAAETLAIDGDDSAAHNLIGLAHLQQANIRDAEYSFLRAVELAPDIVEYRTNLARAQARRGNDRSAIATLEKADQDLLQNLVAGLTLAMLKVEIGAGEEALVIAKRLQQIHPAAAAPHALEGELLLRGGNLSAASAVYDAVLALENTFRYTVRAFQVRNRAGRGDYLQPVLDYIDAYPLDNDMRMFLAQVYHGQDDTAASVAVYEQILDREPGNVIAANNLAWTYLLAGDDRAVEAAKRAYEHDPDNSSVLDTLGWILVSSGNFDEGIELLRRAADLDRENGEIRFHLATALAESGASPESKLLLQELLAEKIEFPSRKDAESLLSRL